MECEEARGLLDPFIDGELATPQELESHLAGCADCRAELSRRRDLVRRLRAGLSYHRAPPGLAARLAPSAVGPAPARARPGWRPMALAASFLLAMLLSGGIGYLASPPAASDTLAQQVVDSHVRSLLANHLTDVASSDQHTVKPWFDGRLDTAPPVSDFAAQGFPLVGGRLDYLDHRPVAALVYRHRQHPINLFVWADPSRQGPAAGSLERQGYNIRHWRQGDLAFWLISDADSATLARLEELLRGGQSSGD